MRQDAEELRSAWTATVGGQSKESLDGCQDARGHAIRYDALQIKIAAARAVGVVRESGRHPARVKPKTAGVTSPGPQSDEPIETIDCASAT